MAHFYTNCCHTPADHQHAGGGAARAVWGRDDRAGLRTQVTDTAANVQGGAKYTYDGLQRLTAAAHTDFILTGGAVITATQQFTASYDLAGNRLAVGPQRGGHGTKLRCREPGGGMELRRGGQPAQRRQHHVRLRRPRAANAAHHRRHHHHLSLRRHRCPPISDRRHHHDDLRAGSGRPAQPGARHQPAAAPPNGWSTATNGCASTRRAAAPGRSHDLLGSQRLLLDDSAAVLAATRFDPWGTPLPAYSSSALAARDRGCAYHVWLHRRTPG